MNFNIFNQTNERRTRSKSRENKRINPEDEINKYKKNLKRC